MHGQAMVVEAVVVEAAVVLVETVVAAVVVVEAVVEAAMVVAAMVVEARVVVTVVVTAVVMVVAAKVMAARVVVTVVAAKVVAARVEVKVEAQASRVLAQMPPGVEEMGQAVGVEMDVRLLPRPRFRQHASQHPHLESLRSREIVMGRRLSFPPGNNSFGQVGTRRWSCRCTGGNRRSSDLRMSGRSCCCHTWSTTGSWSSESACSYS